MILLSSPLKMTPWKPMTGDLCGFQIRKKSVVRIFKYGENL